MGDFFNGAFPWIAMGLAFAIIITYLNSKKKPQNEKKQ